MPALPSLDWGTAVKIPWGVLLHGVRPLRIECFLNGYPDRRWRRHLTLRAWASIKNG
ncbi:hypothetical protein HRbin15_01849 [bacterium HR15]|mgnify:CR=1 FL=1|nr:hypothetical protein HRbin15_01849 [bacterium HR15]